MFGLFSSWSPELLSFVSNATLRGLCDKAPEKRKAAASEVENIVRNLLGDSGTRTEASSQRVRKLIDLVVAELLQSSQILQRKGGLLAIASIGVALQDDIKEFLEALVVPVLDRVSDADPKVRFHACEAMYNLCKVAKANLFSCGHLDLFGQILDAIIYLSGEGEGVARQGVEYLDHLLKNLVKEYSSEFNISRFLGRIQQRIKVPQSSVRQLFLSWLLVLDALPGVAMVLRLPLYLEGLVLMADDPNGDVRLSARKILESSLTQIRQICLLFLITHERAPDAAEVLPLGTAQLSERELHDYLTDLLTVTSQSCTLDEGGSELRASAAFRWLHQILMLGIETGLPVEGPRIVCDSTATIAANSPLAPLMRQAVRPLTAAILRAALHAMSTGSAEMSQSAYDTHDSLYLLLFPPEDSRETPDDEILKVVIEHVKRFGICERPQFRAATLQWLFVFLRDQSSSLSATQAEELYDPILRTLPLNDAEAVSAALAALSRLSVREDCSHLTARKLVEIFACDKLLLESSGRQVLKELCRHLDVPSLYNALASHLQQTSDIEPEVRRDIVQMLNWYLLTSNDAAGLRRKLLEEKGGNTLRTLLTTWLHNPVAALALCLWVEDYDSALLLVHRIGTLEASVHLLLQLDHLVHLLECPVFAKLRLRLLDATQPGSPHVALLDTLLALSMLLPQATAFETLRQRLDVVKISVQLRQVNSNSTRVPIHKYPQTELVERFDAAAAQFRHRQDEPEGGAMQDSDVLEKQRRIVTSSSQRH